MGATIVNLSADAVAGPTMPSTFRPRVRRWNFLTAASVCRAEDAIYRQMPGVRGVVVLELALQFGDLRSLGRAEQQDVGVPTDRNGRPRGGGHLREIPDAGLNVGAQDIHVDGPRIPFALCVSGVLLVPDRAAGVLGEPTVDRGTASDKREILCVGPILAMWRGRTGTAVGALDADQVPVAHVRRQPRIHADTRVPRDPDRHHGHRAVAGDVQLGQRTGQIGAAVGDGRGAGGVRPGVVDHDPADVLEIPVAAGSPTGILNERDPFGAKHIGEPDRVTYPWSYLGHGAVLSRCADPPSSIPVVAAAWFPGSFEGYLPMCGHRGVNPQDDPEARFRELERPLADMASRSELGTGQYGGYFDAPPTPPKTTAGFCWWPFAIALFAAGSLAIAGGVAAYLLSSGGPNSRTPDDRPKISGGGGSIGGCPGMPKPETPTEGAVPTATPGGTLTVTDIGHNRTLVCSESSVIVSGMSNTVMITGHCVSIAVSGFENVVTVDSAEAIAVSGFDNRVTFHAGTPQIGNSGESNVVQQG